MNRIVWSSMLGLVLLGSATEAVAQCEALLFDGVDDIALAMDANDDFDLDAAMTLEAWVRVDMAQAGGSFLGARTASGGGAWTLGGGIGTPTDGVMAVSTPGTDAVTAPGAAQPGPWTHIAGTFDGTNLTIFVNGAQVATSVHSSPGSSSLAEFLVLGSFPNTGSGLYFNGAMDEVRIWNVVRTDMEIQQTYMQPLTGNEPGLVGYYKFDEGGGDVILDSSMFGNDGFLGETAGAGVDDPSRIPSGLPFNPCTSLGTPFCFGDGSGSLCPCGNTGGLEQGCANSSGSGGILASSGTASVGSDDLGFDAAQLLPNQPALLFVGENQIAGGAGVAFGDGLRCAGMNVVRLGVMTPDASGDASWGPNLSGAGGWGSGDVRYFQCWYRDPLGSPCGADFNLTNGVELSFTP